MGNCCAAPSGSAGRTKGKKKQNPFAVDHAVNPTDGDGEDKLTVLSNPTGGQIELRYELGRELGRGEFGVTYLCTDKSTREEFACKSISKKKLKTAVDIEDVRREVEIMKHFPKHPNIVSLKDTYEDENAVHLVMPLSLSSSCFFFFLLLLLPASSSSSCFFFFLLLPASSSSSSCFFFLKRERPPERERGERGEREERERRERQTKKEKKRKK